MIILYDFHIFNKIFWSILQMFFPTIKKRGTVEVNPKVWTKKLWGLFYA